MVGQPLDCAQLKESFLDSLATFCTRFASNTFPSSLAPLYGGAKLVPLVKKDLGVRPMAIGESFRRLVCKIMLSRVQNQISDLLAPYQLGVGIRGGAEAVIHSLAGCAESLLDDEVILQVDFENAFNLVSRLKILEQVAVDLPAILNLVNFLYGCDSRLLLGFQKMLLSCLGVHQGCPLAALLFSLALHQLILKIKLNCPALRLNMWYLDDGHICGKIDDVLLALEVIKKDGFDLGLILNQSKCVVFGKDLSLFPADIIRSQSGINVLGVPVGNLDFVQNSIKRQIAKMEDLLDWSSGLDHPQSELLLLRSCLGMPKMNYSLCTVDPASISDEIKKLDSVVDNALNHIVGVPLDYRARQLAHLPLSLGGLGIPIPSKVANIAFVSSYASSWFLQSNLTPCAAYQSALEHLPIDSRPTLCNKNSLTFIPQPTSSKEWSQKSFCLQMNKDELKEVLENSDVRLNTLIVGRSAKGASSWLLSYPNVYKNSKFDKASFQSMLKFSLGVKLFKENHDCPDCLKAMDCYGDHAMTCSVSSARIAKHNSMVDVLANSLKCVGVTNFSNVQFASSENREAPGDLFVAGFDCFGDAYFDLSVINILCPSYVKKSSLGPLSGSVIRYEAKMKKYADLGVLMKPLIVESTGGWNSLSFKFLKSISELVASRSNQSTKITMKNLLSSLSVCLQRHQGAMLVRRCLSLA